MIYNILNGKISVLYEKWPSLLHLRVGGVLPVMEYRGSSAWKEVQCSNFTSWRIPLVNSNVQYLTWSGRILWDLKGFIGILTRSGILVRILQNEKRSCKISFRILHKILWDSFLGSSRISSSVVQRVGGTFPSSAVVCQRSTNNSYSGWVD